MKYFCSLLLFSATLGAQVQPVIYDTIALNIPQSNDVSANNSSIENVINISKTFMGQSKLTSMDVNDNYKPKYEGGNWPEGSWFRGYFSGYEHNRDPSINGLKKFYDMDPTIPNYLSGYWSSHPQPRATSKQIRALIHFDNYLGNHSNFETVVKGLTYLMGQMQDLGGYVYWWTREGQNNFEQNDNRVPGKNKVLVYETGSALAALCEGYLYLKKNNIPVPQNLYQTIIKSADHIWEKDININFSNPTQPNDALPKYNGDYNTVNYMAFGLWSLSKAYKITSDCKYLEKIIELSNWIVNRQYSGNDICNGTWKDGVDPANNPIIYGESKIVYHAIILRGLVEALDAIPKSEKQVRKNLASAIKKATNHIIKYRVKYQGNDIGATSLIYNDINCNKLNNIDYGYYYNDDIVETLALLAYYSRFNVDGTNDALFSNDETQRLKKILNIVSKSTADWIDPSTNNQGNYYSALYMPSLAYYLDYTKAINNNTKVFEVDNTNFFDSEKTSKPVSLDFDHNGIKDEVAYFSTNGDKTFLNVAKMASDGSISSVKKVWESTGYPLELFSDRIVSGDFNKDGYFDDIAVMCDYGEGETRIHVFKGTGTGFVYSNESQGWWKQTGYYANLIGDRMVSGDFDGDGKHDDIAVFYRYGDHETKIHIFRGKGSSFEYLGTDGWWNSDTYSTDNIISNIVSGDFDKDGKHDDIAVFYKNNNNATDVHLFKGMDSSFTFETWWTNSGYPFNQYVKRIVSGNFYDGNKRDDIAVLYESDPGHTNLHLFQGKGTYFNYLGSTGYWASTNYDSKKIQGKIVDFNIENDDKSQIFAMYNVSSKDSKLQVFRNNMYSTPPNFALYEVKDWWKNACYGDTNLQNQYVPSSVNGMANRLLKEDTSDKIADIKIYKNSGSYEVVSQEKIKSIQIFNFSGKMIQEYTGILSNRFRFGILKGNYIVKVSDINNKISTKKILD
ncbi:T9SS type A sorting domain-containing protein [Chryseobacterium viscerum]|uniref:T9SS type A sorting domain-containing protein n=1 Tax=Chryseobacterium viscerum TaxID=1037377 RepID=A0A5N4BKQ1_9FLAO|nr:T9SS type A sorting domain-containing protein [Chryseobacterium viscerum]KAB1228997.1 T9SS type A sorting domain-containing protein [Chryseobacterium viscerum]